MRLETLVLENGVRDKGQSCPCRHHVAGFIPERRQDGRICKEPRPTAARASWGCDVAGHRTGWTQRRDVLKFLVAVVSHTFLWATKWPLEWQTDHSKADFKIQQNKELLWPGCDLQGPGLSGPAGPKGPFRYDSTDSFKHGWRLSEPETGTLHAHREAGWVKLDVAPRGHLVPSRTPERITVIGAVHSLAQGVEGCWALATALGVPGHSGCWAPKQGSPSGHEAGEAGPPFLPWPGLCQESFCGNTLQASIPAKVGEDKDNEELGFLC